MRPNAWVGLVSIVFGIVYGIQAINLPRAPIGNPMSPIYFPLGLGVLMALIGSVLFIAEARKGLNSDDRNKRPKFHFHSMKLIFIVVAFCILYTVMFDYAGFVFSTIVFLMGMLTCVNIGKGKVVQNGIITLCFSFGMWYIFVQVFQISLPSSPLGIF